MFDLPEGTFMVLIFPDVGGGSFQAFLADSDVDGCGGLGSFMFTNDPTKAKRFYKMDDVVAYVNQTSSLLPTLSTGEPHIPRRAFSIQVLRLTEESIARDLAEGIADFKSGGVVAIDRAKAHEELSDILRKVFGEPDADMKRKAH